MGKAQSAKTAPKGRLSLRERAASKPRQSRNWFPRLPKDVQDELLDLRAGYQSGEVVCSAADCWRAACDAFGRSPSGLMPCQNTFTDWMRDASQEAG